MGPGLVFCSLLVFLVVFGSFPGFWLLTSAASGFYNFCLFRGFCRFPELHSLVVLPGLESLPLVSVQPATPDVMLIFGTICQALPSEDPSIFCHC